MTLASQIALKEGGAKIVADHGWATASDSQVLATFKHVAPGVTELEQLVAKVMQTINCSNAVALAIVNRLIEDRTRPPPPPTTAKKKPLTRPTHPKCLLRR